MSDNQSPERNNIMNKINMNNITAGIVAGIFGCTGAALLMINVANNIGLTAQQTSSWIFSIYFFGGLIGVILSLKYKIPISGAYTIAGTLMLLNVPDYSINEFSGAFLGSGIIILIVGITGIKEKILKVLPMPIVMGMIGGSLTKFLLGIIEPMGNESFLPIIVIISFLMLPKIFKKIPPILLALFGGIIASVLTKSLYLSGIATTFLPPELVIPRFNPGAFLSISVPLAILIMGSENAQAMGVLISQGYKPPVNAMTIASGVGSIIASFFGGHAANIAGPMTAICSSDNAGNSKDDRYIASIVNGIMFIIFGIFASVAISFVTILPKTLVNAIAGLSMIGVLKSSYKQTFLTKTYSNGALCSFIIALSSLEFLSIGAPIWALISGIIISCITDNTSVV